MTTWPNGSHHHPGLEHEQTAERLLRVQLNDAGAAVEDAGRSGTSTTVGRTGDLDRPEEDGHKTSPESRPSASMPSVCILAPPLLCSARASDAPGRARPVAARMKGNPSTSKPGVGSLQHVPWTSAAHSPMSEFLLLSSCQDSSSCEQQLHVTPPPGFHH